jgi:hypothetical protein
LIAESTGTAPKTMGTVVARAFGSALFVVHAAFSTVSRNEKTEGLSRSCDGAEPGQSEIERSESLLLYFSALPPAVPFRFTHSQLSFLSSRLFIVASTIHRRYELTSTLPSTSPISTISALTCR